MFGSSLISIFCIIYVFIMILDMLFLGLWCSFYYSYGIPVFKRTIELHTLGNATDKITRFVESLGHGECFPSLKGKVIDENNYFFRNKLVQISFFRKSTAGVMHGKIEIDSEERTVTVTGFVNLYWILLFIFGLIISTGFFTSFDIRSGSFFCIVMFVIFLICYFIEKAKYNKLANEIEKFVNQNERED